MKFPLRIARVSLCALVPLLSWLAMPSLGGEPPAAKAATITLENSGFVITSPAGDQLTLAYPSLLDESQNVTAPTSAAVKGNTVNLEYPKAVKLAIERNGAACSLHFSNLANDSRGVRMKMTLPGEFKDGGKWQLKGEPAKPFPNPFANEQFVLKGNPKPLTLTTPRGGVFTISLPYGWQEIQDGRKWNSENFDYVFTTAMPRGEETEAWFTFKLWGGDADHEPAEPKSKDAPAKPAPAVPKTSLHLTQEGLAIEAGSMGQFKLEYPVFVGERWDDVRKPVERKVSGNSATLRFDGDTRIDVAWQPSDNTLTLTPVNVPASVRSLRGAMLIDFSYAGGGSYKIGDNAETPFPAQKPAKPHIFQGNAGSLALRSADGGTLRLEIPQYSYQELSDNREWGWKIFAWHFDAPCRTGAEPMRVKITLGAPSADTPKLVDRFGQSTRFDFPAKVKSEDELRQDVQTEAAWLSTLKPPTLDSFGGLPGSREKLGLQRTGFFHVEKKDARWVLVDPEGNAFFHLGVCAMNPSDDYTYVAGRERIYEWLPDREGNFKSAWHPNDYWNPLAASFHLANTIRKTGQSYDPASYTTRMIERLRKWGFNSAGAFGAGDAVVRRQANFPHVAHLPLSTWEGFPDLPGTHGVFDPFSDKVRAQVEQNFAEKLPPQANDPLIIGYFLANEPLYEEIPGAVAALDGSHPCKQQLARMLQEQYKTIEAFNAAWQTTLASFDDVAARGLPVKTPAAKQDMQKFTGLFLDAYFRLVTETYRKYDRNHMLIGNRFQPGTINNETLCRLSGKYMDLVSFNYYCYGFDRNLLSRIRGWMGDKPMFFSEFYFPAPPDSGLTGGGNDVASQRDRGLAYRHYVEQAAALGYVVGIEWFTLIDQAATGRFFEKYNGEAANTGLISVADRPWRPMIEEMIKTNYDIYSVFLGQRAPFAWDDPRFSPSAKK
ncbi:MAG: beta-galactosidase [Bacillota bacterium]